MCVSAVVVSAPDHWTLCLPPGPTRIHNKQENVLIGKQHKRGMESQAGIFGCSINYLPLPLLVLLTTVIGEAFLESLLSLLIYCFDFYHFTPRLAKLFRLAFSQTNRAESM